MSDIQTILKTDWIYITEEREQNLQEEDSGKSYIARNLIQKMKQNPENII